MNLNIFLFVFVSSLLSGLLYGKPTDQQLCDEFKAKQKKLWETTLNTFLPGGENAVKATEVNKHRIAKNQFELSVAADNSLLTEISTFMRNQNQYSEKDYDKTESKLKASFTAYSKKLDERVRKIARSFLSGAKDFLCTSDSVSVKFHYTFTCTAENNRFIKFDFVVADNGDIEYILSSNPVDAINGSIRMKRVGKTKYVILSNDSIFTFWRKSKPNVPSSVQYLIKRESKNDKNSDPAASPGHQAANSLGPTSLTFDTGLIKQLLNTPGSAINEWILDDAQELGMCLNTTTSGTTANSGGTTSVKPTSQAQPKASKAKK